MPPAHRPTPRPSSRAGDAVRAVSIALRRHLRARYRLLATFEDDLLQQTIVDLDRCLARRGAEAPALDDAALGALAFTIFERRIVDLLREQSRDALLKASVGLNALESLAPSTERVVAERDVLRAVLLHLAALDADDRALLLEDVTPPAVPGTPPVARSDAERQRLSRLRKRLAHAVEGELGAPLKTLLGP